MNTEKPFIISEDKVILQANALTSSRHAFTACQLDIFFMLLAQLHQTDSPDKFYQVFISDIKAITGREWRIEQLRESIASLGSKPIEIELDEDSGIILWPFKKIVYHKGKGLLDVQLTEDMRPLLFDLKEKFTYLQLKSVLRCSSKFSKRIYALACQWRVKKILTIELSELKEMLYLKDPDSKKEQFQRFADFKRRVLDLAKDQINENTDIELDYELVQRKGSKAFHAVTFFIGVRKVTQLEIDFRKSVEEQKRVNFIKAYGIAEPIAEKMAKHYNYFVHTTEELKKQILAGKEIKDPAAYLVGIFQNQGKLPKA